MHQGIYMRMFIATWFLMPPTRCCIFIQWSGTVGGRAVNAQVLCTVAQMNLQCWVAKANLMVIKISTQDKVCSWVYTYVIKIVKRYKLPVMREISSREVTYSKATIVLYQQYHHWSILPYCIFQSCYDIWDNWKKYAWCLAVLLMLYILRRLPVLWVRSLK